MKKIVNLLIITILMVQFSAKAQHTEHKKVKNFSLKSWISPGEDYNSLDWKEKLKNYHKLGISEILVEVKHLNIDQLQEIVFMAKKERIRVHAWMWTMNRPGDTIANKHPEWYSVNREGKNSLENRPYVDHYQWLSPFHPGAREHVKDNVKRLMKVKGLASVHLDFVRFNDVILPVGIQPKYNLVQDHEMPEYDFGYHPLARQKFKSLFGIDPLDMEHPEMSDEWNQFRYNAIVSLVNEIVEMAHQKKMKITAAVFPFPELARHLVRQDWANFNVDAVYPMLYNQFYNQGIEWIGFATAEGVKLNRFSVYSGIFVPTFKEKPEDLIRAIRTARENGASGVTLFTADMLTQAQKEALISISKEIF